VLKKAKDAAGKESKKMHKIGCEMNETRRRSVFCCLPEGKERQGKGKVRESRGNGYDSSETEVNTLLCVQRQGKVKRKSA